MKKCQNCGVDNADSMNFCGECGAVLKNEPQMVVPLENVETPNPTEKITESFPPNETETEVGNRYLPSVPTLSAQQKSESNKKFFFIVAGFFAAIFLIFGGLGTMIFYYLKFRTPTVVIKPTPAPTRTVKKDTPTPKSSETPKPSPSETPEVTPEETPEEDPEITFPPPQKPTQKGSFTISADDENWQLSGIETVPLQRFTTKVRGAIILDKIKENVSPAGVKTNTERRIYKQFPTGALLMRTRYSDGKTSNIQPVTASNEWQNYPNERGRLEFLINDNSPENNEGEFTVTTELVSVPN